MESPFEMVPFLGEHGEGSIKNFQRVKVQDGTTQPNNRQFTIRVSMEFKLSPTWDFYCI